jgi:hypothetical protein
MKTRLSHPWFILIVLVSCSCLLGPSGPLLAQQGRTAVLVWQANGEEDLEGYRVYEVDSQGDLGRRLDELLAKDIPWKHRIRGIVTFTIEGIPPGYHCWAVTAFDRNGNESNPGKQACISIGTEAPPIHMLDLHEDGYYGSYPGAETSYLESVVYTFDGRPGDLLLTYRLWDINSPSEVEIFLNGNPLGCGGVTGAYQCSHRFGNRIPAEYLQETGPNEVSFRWNPAGAGDMWAVGSVEIVELIPLPAFDFYGNLANLEEGDTDHPRTVGFSFEGRPGAVYVLYEVYDVDFEREIEICVNGQPLNVEIAKGNDSVVKPPALELPDELVLDQGPNALVFSNVLNPPFSLIWGVGNVWIP